jgi:hypothetical protein
MATLRLGKTQDAPAALFAPVYRPDAAYVRRKTEPQP